MDRIVLIIRWPGLLQCVWVEHVKHHLAARDPKWSRFKPVTFTLTCPPFDLQVFVAHVPLCRVRWIGRVIIGFSARWPTGSLPCTYSGLLAVGVVVGHAVSLHCLLHVRRKRCLAGCQDVGSTELKICALHHVTGSLKAGTKSCISKTPVFVVCSVTGFVIPVATRLLNY